MQSFSFSRFNNTLVWQAVNSRRILTINAAVCFLIIVVPALFCLIFRRFTPPTAFLGTALYVAFSVYYATCSAFIVSDISDKKQRISQFLLPSSKLEKFLARYILLVVLAPIAALIGLLAGDLIQMVLVALFGSDVSSVTKAFYHALVKDNLENTLSGLVAAWILHALFLFLGVCFRRHAWIKSFLTFVAVSVVLTILTVLFAKLVLDSIYGEGCYSIELINTPLINAISYIVSLAIIALCYWGSFRLYSRMQAVTTRWRNF